MEINNGITMEIYKFDKPNIKLQHLPNKPFTIQFCHFIIP